LGPREHSGNAVEVAQRYVVYNASMPDSQPQRRRFRFSLRTFLLAFTAIALWLGWNAHLVQRRKDFIASLPWPYVATPHPQRDAPQPIAYAYQLQAKFEAVFLFIRQLDPPPSERTWAPTAPHKTRDATASDVPWIRRLLGDTPYCLIAYHPGPPIDRASSLFPEATVMVADEPWRWPGIKVSRNGFGRWIYAYADRKD
jgi:hypothetical protein